MASDCIADYLRSEQARIAELWEVEVRRDLPSRRDMSGPVLVDHLFEFLDGLAAWVEGDKDTAEVAFQALVEGHALQRLGYGVGLETLTREYSKLRIVLMRDLFKIPSTEQVRESMLRMHEGMDRAINDAMHRYAMRREEVRERFITILGHDLRDPLSTVSISANMLAANTGLDSDQRMVAARISRACTRMQRMINDVLDFARGHLGGGIPAHPSLSDMGDICRAAADEAIGANPQRTIRVDITGDLRGAFDRDRVHQVITNLISNAIHHSEESIEVRAYEGDEGRAVFTEVTSHGAPIPEDLQRRLFDPFAHFDGAAPRRGLGLGLYIVQQIALAHGAVCGVRSDATGTTFSVRWPRTPGAHRRKAANG